MKFHGFKNAFVSLLILKTNVLLRCHLDGAALHFHQKTIRPVQKATHPCSLKVHGRRRLTWLAGCNQHAGRPAPHRCNSYVGGPVRGMPNRIAKERIKRPTAICLPSLRHPPDVLFRVFGQPAQSVSEYVSTRSTTCHG